MFDLTGKVAVVTGASSGIGRATALVLAKQGAQVVVAARRKEKLDRLVSEIAALGKTAHAIPLDITNKTMIEEVVTATVDTYGRLDILVNNAGVLDYTPFLEMTESVWDRVINTNLKGSFLMAQYAAKEMMKQKWGRIVNIASIASGGVGVGYRMLVHYCASKGGIIAMTEAMAIELGQYNILVNAIAPGGFESEMTQGITPEQLEAISARLVVKRLGKPEELGAMIAYLVSEEASYTTGSTFYVDGGWLAS